MTKYESGDFNVVVVGTGLQGTEHRIPSLRCLQGVKVVGVVDIDIAKAQKVADDYYAPKALSRLRRVGYPLIVDTAVPAPRAYGALAEALKAERVHGVMVVTPPSTHKAVSLEAFAAKVAVFCDKPTGASLEDAVEMVAAGEAAGVPFTVGYQNAWAVEWMQAQMATAAFGTFRGGHGSWTRSGRIPDHPHFWDSEQAGIIPDLAGHMVAPLVAILGGDRIVSVKATGSRRQGVKRFGSKFKAFDSAESELRMASGAMFDLELSWARNKAPIETAGMVVWGDYDARIDQRFVPMKEEGYVPDMSSFLSVFSSEGLGTLWSPEPPTYPDLMIAHAKDWVRAGKGEKELMFSGRDALTVEQVVAAMQESALADGRLVEIRA